MVVPPIVSRFVAGDTVDAVVDYSVEQYQQDGIKPLVNLLGEHYSDEESVQQDVETYKSVAHSLSATKIPEPAISVKPSQMGLDITKALFAGSVEDLVQETDVRIWVDMESYDSYMETLTVVERLAKKYPGRLGLCLQANIKKTPDVIDRLAGLDMKIRLVKGAYNEPPALAHQSKDEVDTAYRNCIQRAFSQFADTPTGLAVGSHHDAMIQYAYKKQQSYDLDNFEVQMLKGIRSDRQQQLVNDVEVYQYIPFGSKWLSYFYRRVRENKSNAVFVFRSLLGI